MVGTSLPVSRDDRTAQVLLISLQRFLVDRSAVISFESGRSQTREPDTGRPM